MKNSEKMSAGKLDKAAIKELAEILKQTDLSEIEFEANGVKIRVARQMVQTSFAQMPMGVVSTEAPQAGLASPAGHPGVVKSPMVGTVYLSPEPGAMPYVKIGDSINVGQNLLIIEAMKVMNPIKASKAGVVKQILVRDSEPVEFDTPLLIIE
jgi:acetyl-CoA carboxylase biotin carboxyl carrier protein